MIVIQGVVRVSEADKKKFIPVAEAMIKATRAEAGCIAYSYAQDLLEPGLLHIVERWRDQAAIDAHMKSPHMATFLAAVGGLATSDTRIAAYDAAGERMLMGG